MKKITFLLLGLLFMTSASANENEYVPLVREGVKWVYMTYHEPEWHLSVIPEQMYSFEIEGDTTILGKNYKHVYCTILDKDFKPASSPFVYCDVREEDKVVYEYNSFYGVDLNAPSSCLKNRTLRFPWPHEYFFPIWIEKYVDDIFVNTIEFELYDFNRESYLPEINASLWGFDEDFESIAYEGFIEEFRNNPFLTTVQVGNNDRNAYIMNSEHLNFEKYFLECKVIEGIGIDSRSGDLISPQNSVDLCENELMGLVAVYEGNDLVYKGCLYDEAMALADENEYVPIVREGVVWEYVGYNTYYYFNTGEEVQLYTLEFNGQFDFTNPDGVVVEYHNLYRTDYDEQGNAQEPYLIAVVSENGKVVNAYEYEYWWEVPDTLYDFNKPMFLPEMAMIESTDEYNNPYFYYPYPYDMENSKVIYVEVGGSIRKGYHINDDGIDNYTHDNEVKIIEGIGVDCMFGDLLIPYRGFYTGKSPHSKSTREVEFGNPMAGLSAVYENGELVYKGCLYDEAQKLKNPDAITTVNNDKQVSSVRYYNLAGVESSEPFKGVNIKVTTYSDGSRKSKKIIK